RATGRKAMIERSAVNPNLDCRISWMGSCFGLGSSLLRRPENRCSPQGDNDPRSLTGRMPQYGSTGKTRSSGPAFRGKNETFALHRGRVVFAERWLASERANRAGGPVERAPLTPLFV